MAVVRKLFAVVIIMEQTSTSTQQFVDIEDIKDGIIILKNGALRRVLMVSGINFELKSEEEKSIIIGAYQEFLNSLDFSIQIIIHSRKLNIKKYLENFLDRKNSEPNELIREQIEEYVNFIKSFVESNEIMSKIFLVVVPYDFMVKTEGMMKILDKLPFLGGKKKNQKNEDKSFVEKVGQLDQRTDQIINGFSSMGLRSVPLNNEELIELFYNLYNPSAIEKKETKKS